MASTYSPNLRLELIGTGEQQGTWGITTNTNLGTLLEEAIGGYISVAVTDGADTTLTTNNGSADQSRNMVINLTGALTAARNVICPAIEKMYVVKNATTGGFAVTFKVSGQTGVSIPNGSTYILYVNGTDAVLATGTIAAQNSNNVSITGGSITGITDLAVADGGTGASTAAGAATNLGLGTGDSPQFAAVNIGNATDTTITRVSAGVIAVEGKTVVTETGGQTVQFAAGSNTAPSITTTGDTNTGIYFPAADTIAFTEGGTEAMRIDSSGNVGIGTASPAGRLHVRGSGVTIETISDTSATGYSGLTFSGTGAQNYAIGMGGPSETSFGVANKWFLYDGGSSAMRLVIDSSGNVGIGTSSPSTYGKLVVFGGNAYVQSTTIGQGSKITLADTNNAVSVESSPVGVVSDMVFKTSTLTRMTLDASGNLGLGVTPSAWGSNYKAFESAGNSSVAIAAANINGISIISNGYADNTNWIYKTTGAAARYSVNTGIHQWFTAPSGTAGNAISFTQAMTLDASGNLGIGTTSPLATLDVVSTAGFRTRVRSTALAAEAMTLYQNATTGTASNNGLLVGLGGDQIGYFFNYTNNAMVLGTNATERMRIDSSGNVGIGTNTPSSYDAKLAVFNGNLALTTTTNKLYLYYASSTNYAHVSTATDGSITFTNGTTSPAERMRIDSSGNVGIGTSSPSYKLHVSGSFLQLNGYAYLGGVSGGAVYPTTNLNLAFGNNFSNGLAECNIWNTNDPATYTNTGISFNQKLTASTSRTLMYLHNNGNVGIGTSTFGTSAATVLAIATGTAPTTGPADTIQIFSTDLSAGNTILSLRTEGTPVNANTTAAATHRIAVRINGTVYYLLANTAA